MAVLVVDVPFTFSEFVRPVCLPAGPFFIGPGTRCEITKWDDDSQLMIRSTVQIKRCNGQPKDTICTDRQDGEVQNDGVSLVCRIRYNNEDVYILAGVARSNERDVRLYTFIGSIKVWLDSIGECIDGRTECLALIQ